MFGMILKGISSIFGGGIPIIGDLVGAFTDGLKHKRDLKSAIALAKIERINTLDTADVQWDKTMAEGSRDSWKDEWLTVWVTLFVFGIPSVIILFMPEYMDRLDQLYLSMDKIPEWLKIANGIVFAGAFGIKPAVQWMNGNMRKIDKE